MPNTAIANSSDTHFDDWRQMFLDFFNLHYIIQTSEGMARTWSWLCDPSHPATGLIVFMGDSVVGFVHYRL